MLVSALLTYNPIGDCKVPLLILFSCFGTFREFLVMVKLVTLWYGAK